jgi:hypothetical protein
LANTEALRNAVLEAAASSKEVESRGDNGFGDVFILRFSLTTEKGTATVLTGWIVRHGEDFPRLTTRYIVQGMNGNIHMHDLVALSEDTATAHFETGRPLLLRRGQVGTVVRIYDGESYEVEFAGREGRAYALLPVSANKLMVLRDAPEHAAA